MGAGGRPEVSPVSGNSRPSPIFSKPNNLRAMGLHPLRGARKGELSIILTGRWRLIVTRGESEESAIIEEVSNHYGD